MNHIDSENNSNYYYNNKELIATFCLPVKGGCVVACTVGVTVGKDGVGSSVADVEATDEIG